ncbi:hypothetical protein [Maritalea sp.]|uniref:hypothetical protein n=1 Tax=Maritalea sp. TaxID=2003361 RepID=UPI003EF8BC88
MNINWHAMYLREKALREEADERLVQLRKALAKPLLIPADWNLTVGEGRVLRGFMRSEMLSEAQLRGLFAVGSKGGLVSEGVVKTYIHRLRKKLAAIENQPIQINCKFGFGYWMPSASRDFIKKAVGAY